MLLMCKLRATSSPKVVKPQLNGASAPIPLERTKRLEGVNSLFKFSTNFTKQVS